MFCASGHSAYCFGGKVYVISQKNILKGDFEALPNEIVFLIFSFLPSSQLQLVCKFVCKRWYEFVPSKKILFPKKTRLFWLRVDSLSNMPLSFLKGSRLLWIVVNHTKEWGKYDPLDIVRKSAAKNTEFVEWLLEKGHIKKSVTKMCKTTTKLYWESDLVTSVISSFILHGTFEQFLKFYSSISKYKEVKNFFNFDVRFHTMILTEAVTHKNSNVLEWCIKKGYKPRRSDIIKSIKHGDVEFFKSVIGDRELKELFPGNKSIRLRTLTIEEGNVEIVKFVVSSGINYTDWNLQTAGDKGKIDILEFLLQYVTPSIRVLFSVLCSETYSQNIAEVLIKFPRVKNGLETEIHEDDLFDIYCTDFVICSVKKRKYEPIKWLMTKFPILINTKMGINFACAICYNIVRGNYQEEDERFLEWLLERGCSPKFSENKSAKRYIKMKTKNIASLSEN